MKKQIKICVHIPFFVTKRKNQISNFNKVCKNYLKLSNHTKIFVHTNKKINKTFKHKNIKYKFYSFKKDHPFYLTWYPRKLMLKQKKDFDVFIYGEDDILFTNKNLKYWLENKNMCLKNNYHLGFVRVEKNKNKFYAIDHISKSEYKTQINNKNFLVSNYPHCALWIFDKKEFNEFIKTKYFKFDYKWKSISGLTMIREMASIGWHGNNINGGDMGRYISSLLLLKNNKIHESAKLIHLTKNYSKGPSGLFGTMTTNDIIKNPLKNFVKPSKFYKIVKKLKFYGYKLIRINLKKLFKN
jgi:hypothetical protein